MFTEKVVCSWTPQSAILNQEKFFIDDLDVTLCTHFIYPGITNNRTGVLIFDELISNNNYGNKLGINSLIEI